VVGSISDVTERTVRDPLTQLANRLLFSERLTFMRAQRSADGNSTGVAVAVFDLDGFSVINTTLGTEMGDRILVETARRLQETLRSSDALGRAESDRFLLAFAGISREEELDTIMRRALESVSGALEIDGRELSVRVTAGAVVATDPSTSTGNLLNAAELALKSAKQQARGEYVLFSEDMQQSAASRIELSIDLQRARARGELRAVYQPIVDLSTMQPIAVEMLARWHHPNHGLISPAVFIPIAESEGLITGIGEWALDEAVKRLQESSGVLSIRVDVNLSGTHFAAERDLPARISQLLAAKGVPGSRLGIEITETSLVGSQNEASETLEQLRQLGVHRAIDDFGTGYSTLEYLRGLPVDTVKIDRSFVVDCVHNRRDRAMLSSLIQLAKSLNLRTLAEGAEHLEQLAILRELGCDAVQGYCVSRPQEWDDLQEWLRTWDGSEQAVRTTR
jgi:diguanylate cyclase (GGDEF)-like protein